MVTAMRRSHKTTSSRMGRSAPPELLEQYAADEEGLVGVIDPAADAPHNSRITQQLDIQTTADLTKYASTCAAN